MVHCDVFDGGVWGTYFGGMCLILGINARPRRRQWQSG